MCGSHFNCNFSFLGCYLVPVCFLFNNQSITYILPFLTILSCNLMLCLILFKFQCRHNPLWKSVIYGYTNTLFYEFITHVMRSYYRSEQFVRVLHRSEGFARICHICEKFARILHKCDKFVRNFHTCDRFV